MINKYNNILFEQLYQKLFVNNVMMSVTTVLERTSRLHPDIVALICDDKRVTYRDLHIAVCAVGEKLRAMGVQPGNRVALLFENSIEFYIAYYAVWQIGAVIAPLNTFLHEKELEHIVNDANPTVLIVSDQFIHRLKSFNKEMRLPPLLQQQDIMQIIKTASERNIFPAVSCDANEMVALLYTSGTTGFPKGVMISSRNILTNVVQGLCLMEVSVEDKILASLPLFHSFAQSSCVWGNIFVGGTVIIVPHIERKALLNGLRHKPTVVAGVPALYGLFCLMKTVPFDSVRYFICGGDALPDKIRIAFELIYRRRLCNGYGLTETSPLIAINFDDELMQPNTVGRIVERLAYSLRDEQGNEVSRGQKGILWVKGDTVMLGYYNAPQLTAQVMNDGWFDTGDWACIDACDRLVIAGRHKDLIVHKGFNIYPPEIENVLLTHPAVMQAAVIGQPDEDVGEFPVACIVFKEGTTVSEEILRKLCKEHLALYKIPKQFVIVRADQIPLTPLKKIDKKKLKLIVHELQKSSQMK